ncbi:DUF2304 domain-containing protein [Agromyces aerolatus]|uniref:DUF2304 domain-containing protein n=1 Tax=Agromyces sp. LY-1074 TaxID=3074080 RepID=UPI002857C8B9|nr:MULTISPECIES: DUF2304 domain-containing protein [unclassified Agromyces]MDR5700384.1 DUF2304 domain-containing protein [Agromyces sp. LY-1074]MDR5706638.1 DUF2304 domain-containing protein [Agromyces sp. LY-1358]
MSTTAYIFGIIAAVLTLTVVVQMLRHRRLRERHAVWWLGGGLVALVVGLFPGLLDWAARLIGVSEPVNLIFFVSIAMLVLVCIQLSSELTRHETQIRTLAEDVAMLDERLTSLGSPPRPGVGDAPARDDSTAP